MSSWAYLVGHRRGLPPEAGRTSELLGLFGGWTCGRLGTMTLLAVALGDANIVTLAQWLLPFVWLFGLNALTAIIPRLSKGMRWLGALATALTPALLPSLTPDNAIPWGATATIITTLAVISTCRFADLASYRERGERSAIEVFWWMSLPVVREFTRTASERESTRRAGVVWLKSGLVKGAACVPLVLLVHSVDGRPFPWFIKSAVLVLYFVLHLTGVADLLCALCSRLGLRVDILFVAPLLATSPRDFWSRRWNKYISRFALKHVALPLGRRASPDFVLFGVFLTSGIFHEYFAWGVGGSQARLGLMSIFFVLQGVSVWLGTRFPLTPRPWLGTSLTFLWMTLSAPLFFNAIEPALHGFVYPTMWVPKPDWLQLLP